MQKKIIIYKDTTETIDDVINKIAPKIVEINYMNNWLDDNYDDIFYEINSKYYLTQEESVELQTKIKKYLNRKNL